MPKRITILDPNGVEVANRTEGVPSRSMWGWVVGDALEDLRETLAARHPKLGTYTVTIKEVE